MNGHNHAIRVGQWPGRRSRRWAALAVVLLAVLPATGASGKGRRRAGTPKADPDKQYLPSREKRIKLGVDHLTKEYMKQFSSSDWIARCVAMVGLSQMPTEEATEGLVGQLSRDRHAVGQLVAWQAVLARAGRLTDKQYQTWLAATWRMAKKDMFHGDLRIGLLEMIGSAPVAGDGRTYFRNLFAKTNSLDSSDIPTLIAMGHTLKAWGDRELVEYLIRMLGSANTAVRAELVLQAAGADLPWNRTPGAKKAYSEWWKTARPSFTARRRGAKAWRKLKGQFIAAPRKLSSFDPSDRTWLQQLELGRLHLNRLDFAIALDCSRSMRAELERLKRDIRIMFTAFSMIAREVGVGITLFAPGKLVRHLPLTGSFSRLTAYVNAAEIFGPAGEEEWAGALETTMKGSRWGTPGEFSRRAIVLISDEPITTPQFARAMPLARAGAKKGFRIYGVMIRSLSGAPSNPLSVPFDRTAGGSVFASGAARGGARVPRGGTRLPRGGGGGGRNRGRAGGRGWGYYHDLAKATGGRAIDVAVPQGGFGLPGMPPRAGGGGGKGAGKGPGGKRKKPGKGPRPGRPLRPGRGGGSGGGMAVAPIYPGGGPTNRILTLVLTDAIHPLYADRVEPFVKILVAYCQKAAVHTPERRTWTAPGRMEPNRRR